MRPDRLVVGEVRGAEVADLLGALNTGHEGGLGTVHANSAADLPARLEALALGAGMRRAAVHAQVAVGLGAVVHLGRAADGRRVVREVGVPEAGPDRLTRLVTAWTYDGCVSRAGPAAERLAQSLGPGLAP